MVAPELQAYIAQQRANGVHDAQIRESLVKGGWNPADVDAALSPPAMLTAPVYPPLPKYLVVIVSLLLITGLGVYGYSKMNPRGVDDLNNSAVGGVVRQPADDAAILDEPNDSLNVLGNNCGSIQMTEYFAKLRADPGYSDPGYVCLGRAIASCSPTELMLTSAPIDTVLAVKGKSGDSCTVYVGEQINLRTNETIPAVTCAIPLAAISEIITKRSAEAENERYDFLQRAVTAPLIQGEGRHAILLTEHYAECISG